MEGTESILMAVARRPYNVRRGLSGGAPCMDTPENATLDSTTILQTSIYTCSALQWHQTPARFSTLRVRLVLAIQSLSLALLLISKPVLSIGHERFDLPSANTLRASSATPGDSPALAPSHCP